MHNPSSSYPQIVMLVLSLFTLHPLLHDNKPVYRLPQQSIRRLAFVPPYSVFCSISFRCGGLSIERNQKPLAPEITLAVTHHDRQKQVEVKRSSRVNPHEIRLFSGCPYYFTLPVDRYNNALSKQLRQPRKKRRAFCMDMDHIIIANSTTHRRKKGGRHRCQSALFPGWDRFQTDAFIRSLRRIVVLRTADVMPPPVVAHHFVAISDHPGAQLFHHNFYAALTAGHALVPEHCYLHCFPSIACVVSLFAFGRSTNFACVCKNQQSLRVTIFSFHQSFL